MKYNRNVKGNELRKINGRYESRYFHDAEFVHSKLNEISPSFCLAKWFNVSIHIPTGRTHSCYHPPTHQIPLEEVRVDVSALHNTSYKKIQRKDMLEGKRPNECNFCWQIEDSGTQLSDRAYRSKDVYEEGLIEEAQQLSWSGDAKPRYVEINFNQACNFKCSYCSPHLSTAWMTDIEKNGAFILADRWHNDLAWVNKLGIDNSLDNPYLNAFWEWLPDIYPTLHTFRMTGGEPLMDKNTFKMFEYVKQNPKPDLHLSITSNCCPPGDQWSKFMISLKEITNKDAVDHFMLYCSLDSWGAQAEYIRNGMDFDMLYKNVKDYLANSTKHSLTFIVTFNALSYTGWNNYIRNILQLRKEFNTDRQLIWFDIPQLHDPDYLNPKLFPELVVELEKSLEFMKANPETRWNEFKGFNDFEVSKVQRLIDWIKADTGFNKELAMKNFYLFWSQHDTRRNTNFLNTFPELEKQWDACKDLNE
jgi:sulfatase maturation enzyme AslB (radical SAM superfamily)